MFQAPAFAKNQVTYPFRKTAAEAINVQVGIDASLSPHHVLPPFPPLLPFSPLFQIRSNYSPLSDSDDGGSNF